MPTSSPQLNSSPLRSIQLPSLINNNSFSNNGYNPYNNMVQPPMQPGMITNNRMGVPRFGVNFGMGAMMPQPPQFFSPQIKPFLKEDSDSGRSSERDSERDMVNKRIIDALEKQSNLLHSIALGLGREREDRAEYKRRRLEEKLKRMQYKNMLKEQEMMINRSMALIRRKLPLIIICLIASHTERPDGSDRFKRIEEEIEETKKSQRDRSSERFHTEPDNYPYPHDPYYPHPHPDYYRRRTPNMFRKFTVLVSINSISKLKATMMIQMAEKTVRKTLRLKKRKQRPKKRQRRKKRRSSKSCRKQQKPRRKKRCCYSRRKSGSNFVKNITYIYNKFSIV